MEVGFLELLRGNRTFRSLYLARLTSLLGDWFNMLAVLALLRHLGLADASSFGWVLILKTLPALVMTPVAGVLADRLSRKRILITCDLLRGAVVATMLAVPLLSEAGAQSGLALPPATLLYGLLVVQTCLTALAEPSRIAILPDVVEPQALVTANALNAATWSAMFTVGTALGGLVTSAFGWQTALVVDVASYLVSAGLVLRLAIPSPGKDRPAPAGIAGWLGLTDLRDGARFMLGDARVMTLALCKSGFAVAGSYTLVITVLGERTYAWGPQGLWAVTALYMARGLGTGLGPIVSRKLAQGSTARLETLIGAGYLWAACLYFTLGFAPNLALASFVVLAAHLGGATVWVFSTVRLQQLTPSEVRGRVFATESGLFTLMMSISTFAFGWAIDTELAPLETIASAQGVILLAPTTLWWLRRRWLNGRGTDPLQRATRRPPAASGSGSPAT